MENLGTKISTYGRDIVDLDGVKMIRDSFINFNNLKIISDFKELEIGCETWFSGEKYPMRTIFDRERANLVHQFKRWIPSILKTFNGNAYSKLIATLYFKRNFKTWINVIHYGMSNSFFNEPKRYAEPVYEVYKNIKQEKIRDIICAILQWDLQYRYRMQDILSEINKDDFTKSPVEELQRLWNKFCERSGGYNVLSIKGFKFSYLRLIFIFFPKIKKDIIDFVNGIDIEKIKLSKEDMYWCCEKGFTSYDIKGLGQEERNKMYAEFKNG